MKHSILTKIITLFCFVVLLSSYVTYRAGKLDRILQPVIGSGYQSQNEPVALLSAPDSPAVNKVKADDHGQSVPTMMSSSKSLILYDQRETKSIGISSKEDSIRKREVFMMTSSKSGPVFRPQTIDTGKVPVKK